MNPAPSAPGSVCASCGGSLGTNDICVSCLLRAGLDDEVPLDATRFGDFEIERADNGSLHELGRGAMGVTYRAHDTVLNRAVALKVIETGNSQAVRERFLREARAAAALRHPNIAAVFQFGALPEGERCYCAMELVEGETLDARVRREGPLGPTLVVEIAIQVTRALLAAAERGLVHRDLKPGNIMLARGEGAQLQVKVIDFGLAKAASAAGEMELTQGGFVGTPAFASPEQFARGEVDARTDIYALGVTMWFALTGRLPFPGTTIDEIRERQAQHALPVEQLKARAVPHPLIDLLRACLAFDPAKRPASARELLAELEARRAQTARRPRRRKLALAGLSCAFVAMLASLFFLSRTRTVATTAAPETSTPPQKSIAVLPFENLSDDKQNAFFTDGVQDEILTDLAKVADLKVISRSSVMQYKTGARDLQEIGRALKVSHVVEGSVQRSVNRVRVTAQLIDARNDTHVWAEKYDRELADVFAIQSEIAQTIADQLQAKLSPKEKVAIKEKPTKDLTAYDLYLRANELHRGYDLTPERYNREVALLDEAVTRDPSFATAFCLLADAHLAAYWFDYDHTPARLELARKALDAAARLEPDAGEVHLVRGIFYYHGQRDYMSALAEFALARRALPNNSDVLKYLALVEWRQGHWAESTAHLEEAVAFDPHNAGLLDSLAGNYGRLGRHSDMIRIYDGLIAWQPLNFDFATARALADVFERGDLTRLEAACAGEAAKTAEPNQVADVRLGLALWKRDYHAAETALAGTSRAELSDTSFAKPRQFTAGIIAKELGNLPKARMDFEAARERVAATLKQRPDDPRALSVLAQIDAEMGRKEDAIREGELSVKLLPVEKDDIDGSLLLRDLAITYARVGEKSRALDLLEEQQRADRLNYGLLKIDPIWDPLRNEPRFQKLLATLAPKDGKL